MTAIALTTHPEAGNPLATLVADYIDAKRVEDQAKKHRLEIEERILALAPAKEEGSQTIDLENGFKLTTTGGLSYSIDDMEAFRNITRSWDAQLVPLKTKTEADEAGFKYLRRERPDLWAQLAKVVTIKPRKTALKVAA